ncbi:MAG: HAMP domain-containing histidine kinase, partial [Pirellulales bacterium]|nr:HAMP domain-containing histidine kinase [Pirellulales bacterium]
IEIASHQFHLRVVRSRLSGRSGDGEGMAWVLTDETQQRLATEARDQFLMTATHELRTPLTNLQAYAEALQEKDGLEVEHQKEFCNVITSEAHRLGRLVDQLLTVSQMEAGAMTANRHELELLPMLEQTADQLQGQAQQKQMQLTTKLAAKLPTVFGDRDKLQAALVNLVGNAIKYTPAGGEVVLRCTAEERWVRIDVEDNGPGIPEDEQDKVFDKFYRGDATRDSEQRGNGLGLAFAREIARLHGGDIELQSTVGEGSIFTLRLPVGGQSRSGI